MSWETSNGYKEASNLPQEASNGSKEASKLSWEVSNGSLEASSGQLEVGREAHKKRKGAWPKPRPEGSAWKVN